VSRRTLRLHVIREPLAIPLVAQGAALGVVPVVNEEPGHVEPPTQGMQVSRVSRRATEMSTALVSAGVDAEHHRLAHRRR
jgi:hypothetical protein